MRFRDAETQTLPQRLAPIRQRNLFSNFIREENYEAVKNVLTCSLVVFKKASH